MEVPNAFATIEQYLYRISSFDAYSLPFLRSLDLKTLVVLDSGTPAPLVRSFADENHIEVVHFGTEPWRSPSKIEHQQNHWMVLSEAMKYILDVRNYPLLILGSNILTGLVRKIQNYTLSAILAEYNSISSIGTHVNMNYDGSIFLELVILRYDKVENLPQAVELENDRLYNTDEKTQCESANNKKLAKHDLEVYIPVVVLELPEPQFVPSWVNRFS